MNRSVLIGFLLLGACLFPGGDSRAQSSPSPGASGERPRLPLRTESRFIVDAAGKRFKLAGVNWYGAEELDFVVGGLDQKPLDLISWRIRETGFNCVRLPWSNEMYERNPVVPAERLAANTDLAGKRALDVLDAVIRSLTTHGLVVILVNHVSRADWCCTDTDGNGLWYTPEYPESAWIADWLGMVKRYKDNPAVAGVDLRNEPRTGASWGGLPKWNWKAAAQRCGDAILGENRDLLIVVEGTEYATDLSAAYHQPLHLAVPGRLVYSVHDYAWFHPGHEEFERLHEDLGKKWGFLLGQGQSYTAPVWVSEFGASHPSVMGKNEWLWFRSFRQYLAGADIDWAWWAMNGTQSRGTGRTLGAEETYGILDLEWRSPAAPEHLEELRALQTPTEGPGVGSR